MPSNTTRERWFAPLPIAASRTGLLGGTVATVEGLGPELAARFLLHGAAQCGFCTPGFVLMAHELLRNNPDPSEEEIRNSLSGNLCRCGAYAEITRAVQLAVKWRKGLEARPALSRHLVDA